MNDYLRTGGGAVLGERRSVLVTPTLTLDADPGRRS